MMHFMISASYVELLNAEKTQELKGYLLHFYT